MAKAIQVLGVVGKYYEGNKLATTCREVYSGMCGLKFPAVKRLENGRVVINEPLMQNIAVTGARGEEVAADAIQYCEALKRIEALCERVGDEAVDGRVSIAQYSAFFNAVFDETREALGNGEDQVTSSSDESEEA